jgi:hypothetical protein
MAIGQLFDYRRFVRREVKLAVLLPRRPGPDVEALLASADISVVWRSGEDFEDNAEGTFV